MGPMKRLVRRRCRWVVLLVSLGAAWAGADEPKATFYASKRSKIYHARACAAGAQIAETTTVRFATEAEAQASGRRLCKMCADLIRKEAKAGPANPPKDAGGPPPQPKGPAATATSRPAGEAPEVPPSATVKKVLPGGTLVIDGDEHVCLAGVACPLEAQPLAKEAARFIREQTRNRRVRLIAPAGGARRDALGRLQVYLFAQPGDRDLGEELLYQGLGWLDRTAEVDRAAAYLKQEEDASHNHRGVWKPEEGEAGTQPVMIGRHAYQYHPMECPHNGRLTQPQKVTLNEAKARRMSPCEHYRATKSGKTANGAKDRGAPTIKDDAKAER